jgi:MerR family copper efflux transcriptional regulator
MQISELSAQTGVSTHRLRRYESMGLISSERKPNGYRTFSAKMVRAVVFIDMSRKIGFSLTEIAELIPRYKAGTLTAKEMVEAMQKKVKEIDALIASKQLHRQMLIDHIAWFKSRKRKSK